MRLPLTIGLALLSALARAETQADAVSSAYAGDDHVRVLSSAVNVRARPREDLEVQAGYDVDVISAASVDVVTAASPRGFSEIRQGAHAGTSWEPSRGTTLSLRLVPSWERDYASRTLALAASSEWLERRLTMRIGYRLALDLVGRSGAPDDWHDLTTNAATLEIGWILDRNTVGAVSYELQLVRGFLASPYRFVPIGWPGGGVSVPESMPDSRDRHAASVSLRRAFDGGFFGALSYRFYGDDWGVASHTGEASLERAMLDDRLVLGASARGYRQGAADFQRETYTASDGELPRFRSRDKLLAESWSVLVGTRAEVTIDAGAWCRELRLVARIDLFEQRFLHFAPLAERAAVIGSLGLAAALGGPR